MFRYPQTPAPDELPTVFPDLPPEFADVYAQVKDFTMTSAERMYALWEATRHVLARGVPGAFVECGVWRGGSAMIMASVAGDSGDRRELWLYDTFSGMPEAGVHDRDFQDQAPDLGNELVQAAARLEEVQRNLAFYDKTVFVSGKVEDTIPARAPAEIALCRLDTDWESSTRHELEHLWPLLSPGGVLIIDDYGHWQGARRAVDEFFAGRGDAPLLVRVDYTGRLAVKQR